jgi:hypothetical protein
MPTPDFLIKWIAQHGEEAADRIKNRRGSYGTLMHHTIEELLINNKIDLDTLPEKVEQYFKENDTFGGDKNAFTDELYKDITGFSQFMIDRNVKPIAIEVVLKSDKYRVAGALDLFCELDWKGTRKKAIIDFKGKKGGFYENNEIQLSYYKKMLLEEWPEFKNEDILLFNWSGNNWKDNPTYQLKNQTGKHSDKELKLYSDLYREKTKSNPVDNLPVIDFHGVIDISKGNIDNNYTVLKLNKKVKQNDTDQKQKQTRKNSNTPDRVNKNRGKKKKRTGKGVSGEPRLFQG